MSMYVTYSQNTGEITTIIQAPTRVSAEQELQPDEALFEGFADAGRHWIDDAGDRRDRIEMHPAVTTSEGEAAITGLPDPCEVRAKDEAETTVGGGVTIEVDVPGTYTVVLRARPRYFDRTLEVEIP